MTEHYQHSVVTTRLTDPARTVVSEPSRGWLATFTDGARTVTLAGPARRFAEPNTPATIETTTWVRVLDAPFAGSVDVAWLFTALDDPSPDLFGLALQYVKGAPAIIDDDGLQIAGEASYGPLGDDGPQERSDFNDYLGISWAYPTWVDTPEPAEFRCLDCSGYIRMIWGYRSGIPMSWRPDGTSLPRRAVFMAESAPGIMVIPDSGTRTTEYDRLAPGDLVFFDVSTNDGHDIDHVAMYLGLASAGHHRFISSRKGANRPTMGDTKGKSILDGTGLFARGFRAARRL